MDLVQIIGICPYSLLSLFRNMRETIWVSIIYSSDWILYPYVSYFPNGADRNFAKLLPCIEMVCVGGLWSDTQSIFMHDRYLLCSQKYFIMKWYKLQMIVFPSIPFKNNTQRNLSLKLLFQSLSFKWVCEVFISQFEDVLSWLFPHFYLLLDTSI